MATKKEKIKAVRETLSNSSKKVFDYLFKDWKEILSKDGLKEYNLSSEESDKPYYIISHWDSGDCGNFATKEELDDTVYESLTSTTSDTCFEVKVFDVKNNKKLEVVNLEIDVKYDLIEEC